MPVVPFDPTRARPRGQARPPKLPAPASTAVPPRAGVPERAGVPARAGLPPATGRPGTTRPAAERPQTPGAALAAGHAPVIAPPAARWSSEPTGGVMMPAATPLPTPRLAVNLSPAAATRVLAMLGLGIACSAAVATTLTVLAAQPGTLAPETPAAFVHLTNWLVSVPWLFVAVVLAAAARVERLVRPEVGPAWATLAFAAAACGAMQVIGRDLVSTWMLVTRAGLIVVATAALSVAFRQFLGGPSKLVRAQIVAGAVGGLLAGLGPFAMLGRMSGLGGAPGYAPLDAMLNGADALLGLVLATFTIQATLVYVRDFLPDFNIALETSANTPEPELTTAAR
jgi:hypothetical protein